ncbi:RFA2 Single-stranded DNA-binding replication protein A RPA medium subunit [Pyrenophora tritici-repentis]|uniref:RFA2, Single-stranded DNA-binding replication protein A (RPA), medium subunit n=1 Tax=Pyrenophora tritici-repentis TaxID=45151 RepID=A0A2W1HIP1_9PLEO|nr:replication factor-a protein [Pyrenophora tritici-repentis]KAF7453943.1 replication factor-a protein [Pyrenophora tritici-repentis]KAF7577031.1 RFA2, Single-stranded DNA-binding replication protein A (RPA), medium subunit [Pyrenophora tritici-repentis]KAG9387698.1 replication factor-a protein [Pyrenophora tritici-repentis]KAI0576848.1 replication factor-a protein [Pyrenophora tritici-repentis]
MNYNGYETSYTSYGAGGGAGGGGFIPGEGGSTQSPGNRRDHSHDSLRPVTIKQILEAQGEAGSGSDQTLKIDGAVLSQLTLVGQIRNISNQTTNTTYRLDDGTGSIEVKVWVDSDSSEQPNPTKAKLVEGAYCRAWGKLKIFNDRRSVGATVIRPIEDMNEVSFHLLEATAVHLHFTRGPPGGARTAGANANGAAGQQQQKAAGGEYGGYDLSKYGPVAKKVFQYLREAPQSNEGLNQHEIAAKLGIDTADVAKGSDELLSAGLIYTTVDDQTWAILEAD